MTIDIHYRFIIIIVSSLLDFYFIVSMYFFDDWYYYCYYIGRKGFLLIKTYDAGGREGIEFQKRHQLFTPDHPLLG